MRARHRQLVGADDEPRAAYAILRYLAVRGPPPGMAADEAEREAEIRLVRELIDRSHQEYERGGAQRGAALQAARLARRIGESVPEWAISADEENRSQARQSIERCEEEFFRSRNPMYAFEAYLDARSAGDQVPTWVLGYFDEAIREFWVSFQLFWTSLPEDRGRLNRPDEIFLEAFGIKIPKLLHRGGKSGRGTIWTRFADRDWLVVGYDVMELAAQWAEEGCAIKETEAVKEVVRRHNRRLGVAKISFPAAWRAWARYKRRYPEKVAELAELSRQAADRRFKKSATL